LTKNGIFDYDMFELHVKIR